ncbi:MAG: type II secretion system protein [Candidatus Levybacteria bacterium]|nr:type II secretion system protein [Candidatus Levybacteria bacterium]
MIKLGYKHQKGFTLIEVILVMSITAMLFGVIGYNMVRVQSTTSIQSSVDGLVSDLRFQQSKAMIGATEGRSSADSYGIYFLSDQYVLFHGNSYNSSEPTNFSVELPSNIEIANTTFPSNIIVFSALSGEISGFSPTGNTITLKVGNASDQATITLNRYGVVTNAQ